MGQVIVRADHVSWNQENLVFEVIDTGIGIPADQIPSVFDAFYQCDRNDYDPAGQGVGLGLAIVKKLVSTLGGRLSIQSAAGSGTSVTVSLRCKSMMTKSQKWITGDSLPVAKNVPDIAFQLFQNSLKSVDRDILPGNLKALQCRVGYSCFSGKLGKCQISTTFPQKLAKPLPEVVTHPCRMASRSSHIWDFSLDVLSRRLYILAKMGLQNVLPLPKDYVFLRRPKYSTKGISEGRLTYFCCSPEGKRTHQTDGSIAARETCPA